MVGRIVLHYGSGREYSLYPQHIVACDWDPAKQVTMIDTTAGATYECQETPDQIDALIQSARVGVSSPTQAEQSGRGVGGLGPVYGDGSALESRGNDTASVGETWHATTHPGGYDGSIG